MDSTKSHNSFCTFEKKLRFIGVGGEEFCKQGTDNFTILILWHSSGAGLCHCSFSLTKHIPSTHPMISCNLTRTLPFFPFSSVGYTIAPFRGDYVSVALLHHTFIIHLAQCQRPLKKSKSRHQTTYDSGVAHLHTADLLKAKESTLNSILKH